MELEETRDGLVDAALQLGLRQGFGDPEQRAELHPARQHADELLGGALRVRHGEAAVLRFPGKVIGEKGDQPPCPDGVDVAAQLREPRRFGDDQAIKGERGRFQDQRQEVAPERAQQPAGTGRRGIAHRKRCDERRRHVRDDRLEQLVLAVEMIVDRLLRDARLGGDQVHAGRAVAEPEEDRHAGLLDRPMLPLGLALDRHVPVSCQLTDRVEMHKIRLDSLV